ncbi:MAG: DALR anticodon-binding domain-containing protein [Paracoccaceae bacterium]|nr:DALR anticodon-binding domain-containing protein [Paracoccaceae bacterium]
MFVHQDIHRIILAAIRDLQADGTLPGDLPLDAITVAPPRDPLHGQLTTNAAMVLARAAGQTPRLLADALAQKLRDTTLVQSATAAGPGFLNLTLQPLVWQAVLPAILSDPDGFARGESASGKATVTLLQLRAPLDLHHLRVAVTGDAIAWLMQFAGYGVSRQVCVANDPDGVAQALAGQGIAVDHVTRSERWQDAPAIEAAVAALQSHGDVYAAEDGPKLWFRSTAHGDSVDRPLQDARGAWSAFACELARCHALVQSKAVEAADLHATGQGVWPKASEAAVDLLSAGYTRLDSKGIQAVQTDDPTLTHRLDPEFLRLAMLACRPDNILMLNEKDLHAPTRDNPAFLLHYIHARITAALRAAAKAGVEISPDALARGDLSGLCTEADLRLLTKLADWPRQTEIATRLHEPHRIIAYLHDLAQTVHDAIQPVRGAATLDLTATPETPETPAKIALLRAVAVVISTGLGILGITPAEEMR